MKPVTTIKPTPKTHHIVDERCQCGCYKSSHRGFQGHGGCNSPGCPCGQFTWFEFIFGKAKVAK